MKYRRLGKTGLNVSTLSFGASSLGSVFRPINEKEGIRTVHEAIDNGINLIDVSPYYGLTKAETVLGKAMQEMDRDRFYLSTKAGRYGDNEFDFSAERIVQSVDESLKRLNTDYLDFLHLHDIEFASLDQIIDESIPTLNRLKEEGKIRFTGITGLPLKVFKEVLSKTEVDTIITYCRYTLNDRSLLDVLPMLNKKNVGVINASPLSMGLLSNRSVPDWHPAGVEVKEKAREAQQFCQKHGKDLTKLAIQYSVLNKHIPTTLVGTANPDNINKNISWIDEPIDYEILKQVLAILSPVQNQSWQSGRLENNDEDVLMISG